MAKARKSCTPGFPDIKILEHILDESALGAEKLQGWGARSSKKSARLPAKNPLPLIYKKFHEFYANVVTSVISVSS